MLYSKKPISLLGQQATQGKKKKRTPTKGKKRLPQHRPKNLSASDPMMVFFTLTAQSVKINSPYMDAVLDYKVEKLYLRACEKGIPFYSWYSWIEDQLNRLILT